MYSRCYLEGGDVLRYIILDDVAPKDTTAFYGLYHTCMLMFLVYDHDINTNSKSKHCSPLSTIQIVAVSLRLCTFYIIKVKLEFVSMDGLYMYKMRHFLAMIFNY